MLILHPETDYMRFPEARLIFGLCSLMKDAIPYIVSKGVSMPDIKLLEIGVYNGESTFLFSSCIKNITVVEPWIGGYDENDVASYTMSDHASKVRENFMYLNGANIISNIIMFFKQTSDDFFANTLYKKEYDMIYIDGNHSPEAFKKDLDNSIALNPYVISGHDFTQEQIQQTLVSTFPNTHIKSYEDTSWMVELR